MTNRVAVIGCGAFGAMAAIRLAESGLDVTVFERRSTPLAGASFNNQNRLHLGFHYPRDMETAQQCIRGFQRFCREFSSCILEPTVNGYFVASEGSLISPEEYLRFADQLAIGYERIDLAQFAPAVRGVALGIAVPEVVYDCGILRDLLRARLDAARVRCLFDCEVTRIDRDSERFSVTSSASGRESFDIVVNCTYADTSRFDDMLGHASKEHQYEYTLVPVLEWEQPPVGITIMDGSFMTVMPFGKTGKFLLYHVEHSVLAREKGTQLPVWWRDVVTSPAALINRFAFTDKMFEACAEFLPDLVNARVAGFLEGPRVVLSNRDKTDARPSIVTMPEPRFINVFSGKIDHCMWSADEVLTALGVGAWRI